MFALGTFLFYVFSLSVGSSPFDAQAFAQLKGEWLVDKVVAQGVEAPTQDWKGKKVVFTEATAKPKAESLIFHGRLRTKGKMSWLEMKTLSSLGSKGTPETTPVDEEYSCSYQLDGKTMKMLILRVQKPNDRGPGALLAGDTERGMLFFLRRK